MRIVRTSIPKTLMVAFPQNPYFFSTQPHLLQQAQTAYHFYHFINRLTHTFPVTNLRLETHSIGQTPSSLKVDFLISAEPVNNSNTKIRKFITRT